MKLAGIDDTDPAGHHEPCSMFKSVLKYLGVAGGVVLALGLGAGCTEEELYYCDPTINSQCHKVPGHYCDYLKRRCLPLEAGVSTPDGGGGG